MNNIENRNELRQEIIRLKQKSEISRMAIKSSFQGFKNSLTPLNILISIYKEINKEQAFKNVFSFVEKIRDFFKK